MQEMKKLVALVLALAMVLSLASCGSGSSSSGDTTEAATDNTAAVAETGGDSAEAVNTSSEDETPVSGGSMTVYCQEFYNNYDPSLADNRNYALWYERLWSPDWDSSREDYDWSSEYITMDYMTGQLAESWEVADDYSSMTVTLVSGVKFQTLDAQYDYYGGRELTASDVAWSYDRLLGLDGVAQCEAEQDWSTKLSMLESCEVVDDQTIIFHFNTQSEPAINDFIIAGVNIAGPEWDTLTADQQSDWHYACGTGPFMVTDYVADSYMTFAKNPDYYMVDADGTQLPYLDEVTMVVIPDTSNVVAQFISGSLDYIGWGNDVINSSEKQQIRDSLSADAFTEYSYTTNPCGIFLKQCYEPFQDINVRIAIQKAIDMETVTTQYYGLDADALQLFGIFSQSTDWSSVSTWDDELLDTYSYDPEAAKQLLADAGYPDGFEFTIVLFSQQDVDLYTLAAEMLKEVGIIMNIETVSTPPEMQAVGLDSTDVRCIAGTCCLYALSGGIDNYASFGNNNNGAINDPTLDEMALAIQNATTMEEQVAAAQAEDLYVGQQHYTIQLGPCEIVSSFVSSRVHGLNGERIFKNWNDTTVLTHLWVTD
jgi:peptide/nickel transport system substrate-binding protein